MPVETEDSSPRPGPAVPRPQAPHALEYLGVFLRWKRPFLAVVIVIAGLAAVRSLITRPVYQSSAKVLIERESPNILNFKEVAQVDTVRDDYLQTQYKILQSRLIARRVIETLDLLQHPDFGGPRPVGEVRAALAMPAGKSPLLERAIDAFLARLSIQEISRTRLVAVTFEGSQPDLAADVANTVARHYIEQTVEFRKQTSSDAADWLTSQLGDQLRNVERAEAALRRISEEDRLGNVEERRTLLQQRLKDTGISLTQLSTTRLEKEALYRQMTATEVPEQMPAVRNSPLMQSLAGQLADLERQRSQLLEQYMDRHPQVVRVTKQIDQVRDKMRLEAQAVIAAARRDYEGAAAQEASVSAALDRAKAEMQGLDLSAARYDAAKRDLDASKELLSNLTARQKQGDVARELRASNIRIMDAAVVPRRPARPNHLRDIGLGLLLGLFAGVATVLVLEYLDNTLRTPDDIARHLGIPLLGVVAECADTHPLGSEQTMAGGTSQIGEAYRAVRTALEYSWPDTAPRAVLVTSTIPGEGKTLSALNLALALASVSRRVLLIDADLRRPTAHKGLKMSRTPGLADVLVGKASAADAIGEVPGSHLAFLPSGTTVPSPADLLTGVTAGALLEDLRRAYDWIVIDSPPVGAVAEALALAPHCDGVITIVAAEMVPRRAALHTLERLDATGARLLGAILNRVHVQRHSYYYRHYYGHYLHHYGPPEGSERHGAKVVEKPRAVGGTAHGDGRARKDR